MIKHPFFEQQRHLSTGNLIMQLIWIQRPDILKINIAFRIDEKPDI